MTTIASYFDINSGSSKREAETAAQLISRSFFQFSNLHGVTLPETSGKSIKVPDSDIYFVDVTYFSFRSYVSTTNVDRRAPTKFLTFGFPLHLPQSLQCKIIFIPNFEVSYTYISY